MQYRVVRCKSYVAVRLRDKNGQIFYIFNSCHLTLIAVSTYTDNSNNNEVKYKYIPKKKFRVITIELSVV